MTINTSIAEKLLVKFKNRLDKYGISIYVSSMTKTLNSIGQVTGISENITSTKLLTFDLFKSSRLHSSGESSRSESKDDEARAYMAGDGTVVAGNHLLIDYDPGNGTYTAKYKVVEVEEHSISGVIILKTLYLLKVAN